MSAFYVDRNGRILSSTDDNRPVGSVLDIDPAMLRMTNGELFDKASKKMKADIERLKASGEINDPDKLPEVHIRGDINVPWHCVGAAIYTMQRSGFIKVGFISQPQPQGGPAS